LSSSASSERAGPASPPVKRLRRHRVASIETKTCFLHTDRETGRTCTRCGRPACPECLHPAPVGAHCWECIKADRPPAGERVRRWNATADLVVTKVIIGVNLAVFLATSLGGGGLLGGGGQLSGRLALFGPDVAQGEWYRLVTSGFIHYGLIHIGFNMAILYRFGAMLEPALGRIRMVALYLAALLAGSFGAVLLTPTAFTGGASGAVFGLIGAAAVGMRQRGIDVWQSGVGPLIAINLVFTFAIPGISIGGHVGGLIGGAAVGTVMLRKPPDRRSVLEGVAVAGLVAILSVAGAVWAAHR